MRLTTYNVLRGGKTLYIPLTTNMNIQSNGTRLMTVLVLSDYMSTEAVHVFV